MTGFVVLQYQHFIKYNLLLQLIILMAEHVIKQIYHVSNAILNSCNNTKGYYKYQIFGKSALTWMVSKFKTCTILNDETSDIA